MPSFFVHRKRCLQAKSKWPLFFSYLVIASIFSFSVFVAWQSLMLGEAISESGMEIRTAAWQTKSQEEIREILDCRVKGRVEDRGCLSAVLPKIHTHKGVLAASFLVSDWLDRHPEDILIRQAALGAVDRVRTSFLSGEARAVIEDNIKLLEIWRRFSFFRWMGEIRRDTEFLSLTMNETMGQLEAAEVRIQMPEIGRRQEAWRREIAEAVHFPEMNRIQESWRTIIEK
ncbi:hypothetical protein [Castellaniella sp.]|uniref:hypothetical protein n=1 Tax=Castellaniella sp. TaxID=1955812 RepID=UPI002B000C3B|nr:hypothetical protein [Castellaniella sp.]